jgi:hypothetical protein
MRRADERGALYRKALALGKEYEKQAENVLLRASLIKQNMIVRDEHEEGKKGRLYA